MREMYVMALDAGTSALRCLIADLNGQVAAVARRKYKINIPPDCTPRGREFDIPDLRRITGECAAAAIKTAGISPSRIAAVSASSQREGMVFLDSHGTELCAGPNLDLRAVMEGLEMDGRCADQIHSITGHLPSLLFAPARLQWFRRNRPDLFEKIACVLTLGEWLLFYLCGVSASEPCASVEIGLGDVRRRCISKEICMLLDLPDGLAPPPLPAGQVLGKISKQAAGETGINEGTTVIQGAPDSHCGLIGLGILETGQTGIVSGWSSPLQTVTSKPLFDTERRIWTGCHVPADRWILESNCGEAGHALDWIKNSFFAGDSADSWRNCDMQADSIPPGSEGVLACIGPEAMNMSELKMRWGGFLFPLPFSASGVGAPHLARAALENIAFALKANAARIEEVSRQKLKEAALGGGLARSRCLKNILPSVLGFPVGFTLVNETSALGAAILAAAGSGLYGSIAEAAAAMKSPVEVLEPDRLLQVEYDEYYQNWLALSRRLKETGEELYE